MNINIDKNTVAELNCMRIAFANKPGLLVRPLDNDKTAVVVIDMINGFAAKGALSSPRLKALIEPIEQALIMLPAAKKIFLRDEHTAESTEFKSFPPHCVAKKESAVVKELERFVEIDVPKNSTNGIFAFLERVSEPEQFHNFLIMGNCTDICILQFALSLRAYLNESNSSASVSVFTDYVDTFALPARSGDAHNLMALKLMEESGVQIFKNLI